MWPIPDSILQVLRKAEEKEKIRAIRHKICDAYDKAGFRYQSGLPPIPEVLPYRDCASPYHPGCSICKPDSETREQESKERFYGFTLNVDAAKKDVAKSICEATLHKIKNSKAYKITKWYGCWELTKKGVFHTHVIMCVDKSDGRYPRKDNIKKMHPYGVDWIEKPKKSWLAWHRYISGAGKEKYGFFGEPFLDDRNETPEESNVDA